MSAYNDIEIKNFMNESVFPIFLKFDIVYDLKKIIANVRHYDIVISDMVGKPEQFLYKLYNYEKQHKRKFTNSSYKARYGVEFRLLLPKQVKTHEEKVKLIKSFLKSVRGYERDLKYVSYEVKLSEATYIHIYICDREYKFSKTVYYTRDYYQNSITKKMCSSKDEGAVLVKKKGDIKERCIVNSFVNSKTRIFVFKTNKFNEFINRFIEFYKQSLLNLRLVEKSKYVFKREKFGELTDRFTKRAKIQINHLKN